MLKKNMIKIILLFITMFFVSGCELLEDPNFTSDKIKFKDDIEINYKDKVDTTLFVESIDDIKIKDENRNKEKKIITMNNYIIECPDFKADELGHFNLTYKLGDYKYTCSVTVKDIQAPDLKLETDKYEITVGDSFNINNIKIKSIKDNLSKKKNIKIKLNGKYNTKKEGTYDLNVTATDEKNNKKKIPIKLTVYPAPKLEIEKISFSLKTGANAKIDVNSAGKNSDQITFISDNSNIASVSEEGVITAKKTGTANINITCGNGLSETVTVTVTSDNKNSASDSNKQQENNSYHSSNKNEASNSSVYNKYFSGNSISAYNSALDYAESILNSGKANGYSLMPDGKGYNVTFY